MVEVVPAEPGEEATKTPQINSTTKKNKDQRCSRLSSDKQLLSDFHSKDCICSQAECSGLLDRAKTYDYLLKKCAESNPVEASTYLKTLTVVKARVINALKTFNENPTTLNSEMFLGLMNMIVDICIAENRENGRASFEEIVNNIQESLRTAKINLPRPTSNMNRQNLRVEYNKSMVEWTRQNIKDKGSFTLPANSCLNVHNFMKYLSPSTASPSGDRF